MRKSVSGLVVKSIVAIDGPRVRFAADAFVLLPLHGNRLSFLPDSSISNLGILLAFYTNLQSAVHRTFRRPWIVRLWLRLAT